MMINGNGCGACSFFVCNEKRGQPRSTPRGIGLTNGNHQAAVRHRGEIAVRIIRAARELRPKTVQVHSAADTRGLAVRMADEAVLIGPPMALKSYLNIANILKATVDTGADAVHPGYGFLAENANFADAVQAAGLCWIGQAGDSIRVMGDKMAGCVVAKAAGVPVVPGSEGRIDDPKLIVWDEDRAAAITRMAQALQELHVGVLPATKPLHQLLARDPDEQAGDFHTRWLEPWLERNAHRQIDAGR